VVNEGNSQLQEKTLASTYDGRHLVLDITISGHKAKAMIDSGAQSNFISPNLVNKLELPWVKKNEPYRLRTVEGELVAYDQGIVERETAPLSIHIEGKEHLFGLDITEISQHEIILGIPWLRASNPRVNWRTGQLQWDMPGSTSVTEKRSRKDPSHDGGKEALRIYVITKEPTLIPKEIPKEYLKYSKLFSDELETGLPEHSRWDHEINLQPGTEPRFSKIYPQNPAQEIALKEYLEENLRKGYIRPSTSPAGYPLLWVPKKNGKLRPCIDYRELNNITIKNRYPLPLITELKDKLYKAKWFTTLDLKGAYNLIRMKGGDEWKTAFRTTKGHFEYLVMPFGLTNAPATFQTMIDHVLRRQLDRFVVVYLDDILIFSETLEEHKKHVHEILQTLQDNKLLVEREKCEFHKQKVEFLGYEILPGEVRMSPSKIESIREWPVPDTVTKVRGFLGFANFYRKYIRGYGGIAIPLTDLTKKDQPFIWADREQEAFEKLKQSILDEPVLKTADPSKPFEVETDASDFALGGQLGQRDDEGRLHPVAFYSQKLHGPQLNYQIHDKELMAIIEAFKEWKHYLSGTTHKVKVYTDHKNLTSFTSTKELNKRQTRWAEFLSEFNFEIIYRKGSDNGRADALSRREDLKPDQEVERVALLKTTEQGNLELGTRYLDTTWKVEPEDKWTSRFKLCYTNDDLLEHWKTNPHLRKKQDCFYYKDDQYVPQDLQESLVKQIHEHKLHGHQGVYKTIQRIRRSYNFPNLREIVQRVIHECDVCNKAKASRHLPYGELQPISPPARAWETVALDFIVKLPLSIEPMTKARFDSIMVVTDKLTKYAYFIPYMESSTATDLAYTFLREIISRHGVPKTLISDRDKLFTSNFWRSLMQQLGVKHKLSTAFHPQTDGQTERLNQMLEQYLRSYINYQQNNWVQLLPTAQMAYNSSENESMKMTPHKANYGYDYDITTTKPTDTEAPMATIMVDSLTEIQKNLQQEWIFLQNRMKHYANQKRLPAPTLKEGDKVYLLRKNVKTTRPSDKLDWKKLGPFKIKKKLSDINYTLSLPHGMRIHPTFHISLLEPAPRNAEIDVHTEIIPEQSIEYEVEKILRTRKGKKEKEYLIKWKNYPNSENTWEPESNLTNCFDLMKYLQPEPQSKQRTNQWHPSHQPKERFQPPPTLSEPRRSRRSPASPH